MKSIMKNSNKYFLALITTLFAIELNAQDNNLQDFTKEACDCFSELSEEQNLSYDKVTESKQKCIVNTLSNNSIAFRDVQLRNDFFKNLSCITETEKKLLTKHNIEIPEPYSIPDPFKDVILWEIIESIESNINDTKEKYQGKAVRFEGYLSDLIESRGKIYLDIRGYEKNGSTMVLQTVFSDDDKGFKGTGYNGAAICELDDIPKFISKLPKESNSWTGETSYKFNELNYKIQIEGDISEIVKQVKSTFLGTVKIYRIDVSNCIVTLVNDQPTSGSKKQVAVDKPGQEDRVEISTDKSVSTQNKENENNSTYSDIKLILDGKWEGDFGDKTLLLDLVANEDGTISGINKVGENSRPVSGSFSGDLTFIEIKLNEPGDDDWDGVFEIEVSQMGAYNYEMSGTWKSNNGKITRDFTLQRQ